MVTKTSPLVAAALSQDLDTESDDMLSSFNNKVNTQNKIKRDDYSLIDPSTKHQIIKQIHDSMDHLKNELLQKGMHKYADDVDHMNKSLEATRKKQDELDRIKREQELIRIEKVRLFRLFKL